jgi:two-component system, chemotaxis family, protein-glutamate methylesterase/glutaminase
MFLVFHEIALIVFEEGIDMPIRVLVVDDSIFMCQVLTQMLKEDPGITVIGMAFDGNSALEKVSNLHPDVITMDVEMPTMNGLECLARIMSSNPIPVIMVSSLTKAGAEPTIKGLELGAVDFVTKPSASEPESLISIQNELIQKVKVAASIKMEKIRAISLPDKALVSKSETAFKVRKLTTMDLLIIGASTGGPRALHYLLPLFPKHFPLGLLILQHMPKRFTKVFAERLNTLCQLEVAEAKTGDEIKPGRILIAPSGEQTKLVRPNGSLVVEVSEEPNLIYKPSIDYLLKSVVNVCQGRVLSVILSGMGADGAVGMQELRKLGARTIAEAEESCVVFGMPKAAIQRDGAEYVENLSNMFQRIVAIVSETR